MREYVFLGCVVIIAACSGARGARQDSLPRDTTTVHGPPAETGAPSPAPDSIASRPRITTKSGGSASPDARTSPKNGGASSQLAVRTPAGLDSVRGIVSVAGTDRDHHVMIAPAGGGRRVEITGALATMIGHTAGADVSVIGSRTDRSIEAAQFVVKTVDGMPAIDGTLKSDGSALYIVTAGGTRIRIAAPPPALVGHDGARVWITGDPATAVASFGRIDPPR